MRRVFLGSFLFTARIENKFVGEDSPTIEAIDDCAFPDEQEENFHGGVGNVSRTKIVCHRGACRTAPENTITAGHIARQQEADIVELDVRQSRDGIPYALHDTTVDRTTDGKYLITELQSTEVDRLDAGRWFGPEFAGEPVSQLDGFFETLKDELGFYVEVNQADAKNVAAAMQRADISEQCFTYSEVDEMRKALKGAAPWLKQMINYQDVADISEAPTVHGAQIIEFNASDVTPDVLEQAQTEHPEIMIYADQPDEYTFGVELTYGSGLRKP